MTTDDDNGHDVPPSHPAARALAAREAARSHLFTWPGVVRTMLQNQAADLADLVATTNDDERPRLARAWLDGWLAGYDDRRPKHSVVPTPNPFDLPNV
jgi:P pilus assembly chaperone PapD